MANAKFPVGDNPPQVTEEGGSHRITLPKNLSHELEISQGEKPDDIRYDEEQRSVTFIFSD